MAKKQKYPIYTFGSDEPFYIENTNPCEEQVISNASYWVRNTEITTTAGNASSTEWCLQQPNKYIYKSAKLVLCYEYFTWSIYSDMPMDIIEGLMELYIRYIKDAFPNVKFNDVLENRKIIYV